MLLVVLRVVSDNFLAGYDKGQADMNVPRGLETSKSSPDPHPVLAGISLKLIGMQI